MLESFFIYGPLPFNVEKGIYQLPLVVLSYAVASFASYAALSLAQQLVSAKNIHEKRLFHWGGAFAMGAGIWSMHFVGMLSYKMRMKLEYDPGVTLLSMLIAIAVAYGVLAIVARERLTFWQIAVGGVLLGFGICGMHYTGMAAMKMDGDLRYTPGLFLLSVLIAIAASSAALWIAFTLARHSSRHRFLYQIGAALVMGAAICGMHYTGMAASVFIPYAQCRYDPNQNFDMLALSIAGITSIILGLALAAGFYKKTQTEFLLANSESKLRAVIDNALDAVIIMDQQGMITDWNRQAETIFGWPYQEAVGQPLASMIIPPEYREAYHTGMQQFLSDGRGSLLNKRIEISALNRHGEHFPAELTVTAQMLQDTYHFTAFVRDITERKQAEEALKEANRHKDEFLATLAHELRNPLAPIRNALYVMRLSDNRTIREKARETAERQVEQMVHLVDDLMDASRITQNKIILRKAPVLLSEVINVAVEIARPMIDERCHSLTVNLLAETMWLDGDLTRLAQLFANLLTNAAKYTEPNGCIEMSTCREGGEAVIVIHDNGIGIAADKLPRIFVMFAQVDNSLERSQGGLGIGLSLVKNLVELHGGSIEAYSEGLGKGSEFTIRLPVIEYVPSTEHIPSQEEQEKEHKQSYRVLVVDDNIASAKTLGWMLELIGHDYKIVHDGATAIEMAKSYIPHVVLLDIGLPKMNGYEVCRIMRQEPLLKDTIFLAQTGWGQEEHKRFSKEAGFDYHLVKPVEMQALQKLLDSIKVAA